MASMSRTSRILAAVGALAVSCLAASTHAQCIGYAASPGPGTFVPGTDDIGLYADDGVAAVAFPFDFNFYGTIYNGATVSSNGTLQFTTASASYINTCLPTATIAGPAIFPFWDDLYTNSQADGLGVFTGVSGAVGSREFVIEWRTVFCCTPGVALNDFEIKFYENQNYFDVVYNSLADRCSATIGAQDGTGTFTEYGCNINGGTGCIGAPSAGLSLRFSCVTAGTAGACCNVTAGTCNIATAATCTSPNTFSGVGTACPANCPQAGACCNTTSGVCTQTGEAGCVSPDFFNGVGSACTPNPCVGACCNPTTGACTTTTAIGCVSPNVFQSLGLTCTVNPCPQPPPPANDNCSDVVTANAPIIPGTGGTVSGNNSAATDDGASLCTAGHKDVYFLFTPATNTAWTFSTCATAPSFDTMISVHTGCPADTTTQVAGGCNDDNCGLLSSVVVSGLNAGTQYIVRVGNYSAAGTGGVFQLDVTPIVSGACCSDSTGACTTTTAGAGGCASGTTYQGDNTTCAAGGCPGQGTCCTSLGNCFVRFSAACPSGVTSNPALTCTAGLCPPSGAQICQAFDNDAPGTLPANWTSSSTGAGNPWVIDTTNVNSAPNAVFTNDIATVSTQDLQLPAVTAAGTLTIDFLSFFTTENTFDGWVVESSTDGGNTWTDIVNNGAWVLNGYNTAAISVNFNSPIAGRPAFSGASAVWTERIGTINANNGDSVIIRFLMASDQSVASTGVWLDNICIGGIQSTAGSGVCCRGATCNTTVASAAACTSSLVPGQTAGAAFVAASSACNTTGNNTTPCCYADYNKAGGISVQDIFDFLNDWFAGSAYANVGGNGTGGPLAVQNIFDFLNAWFAGGC